MDIQFFLQNAWRRSCNLPETELKKAPLEVLQKTEWSAKFERLMRNRLVMGAIRYGKLHEKGKSKYNRTQSIAERLVKYASSGNKEHLVDIANLCLLEFEECNHPTAHFHSIDDGTHVKTINSYYD